MIKVVGQDGQESRYERANDWECTISGSLIVLQKDVKVYVQYAPGSWASVGLI